MGILSSTPVSNKPSTPEDAPVPRDDYDENDALHKALKETLDYELEFKRALIESAHEAKEMQLAIEESKRAADPNYVSPVSDQSDTTTVKLPVYEDLQSSSDLTSSSSDEDTTSSDETTTPEAEVRRMINDDGEQAAVPRRQIVDVADEAVQPGRTYAWYQIWKHRKEA